MRHLALSALLVMLAAVMAPVSAQQSAGRFTLVVPAGAVARVYSRDARFTVGSADMRTHSDTVTIRDSATVSFDTADGPLSVIIQTGPGNPVRFAAYAAGTGELTWTSMLTRSMSIGRNGTRMLWIPARPVARGDSVRTGVGPRRAL